MKKRPGQEIYLWYVSNTDKLNYITVNGSQKTYSYDAKGNVVTDNWKGVTGITYDHRNLPLTMTKTSTYYYRYDDTGQRIYKDASTVKEFYLRSAAGKELAVYDITTNKLKLINMYSNTGMIGRIDVTWNPGGPPSYNKVYYIKDHLGSIRRTVNTSGTIVNAQEYYAYGNLIASYTSNSNDKYKFTGKESVCVPQSGTSPDRRDTETNYDYFGARYFDSDLGKWMSACLAVALRRRVDALASKYPGWSPYNYTLGNPVNLIDPNGTKIYLKGDDEEIEKALKDLRRLAGDDADLFIGEDGLLIIAAKKDYNEGSNKGLDLLTKINGIDEKIGYASTNKIDNVNVLITDGQSVINSFLNASKTHRYIGDPDMATKPHGPKPLKGFEGFVAISPDVEYYLNGNQIDRSQIVAHELEENFYRTHLNYNYEDAHNKANEKFYGGKNHDIKEVLKK